MGIGGILSELIQQKGTNVNQLAQATSISPQTLYSIIRRDSMKVDIEVLIRICRELDVPVEYVYDKYKGNLSEKTNNEISLSAREEKLINKFRNLSERDKLLIEGMIDLELNLSDE